MTNGVERLCVTLKPKLNHMTPPTLSSLEVVLAIWRSLQIPFEFFEQFFKPVYLKLVVIKFSLM